MAADEVEIMTSEARSIDVGHVLDKYELLERVGQGGMAVVYRGKDLSLRREVAVKILHGHLSDYQEARDRFEREARAVAKLRHENILEIFDYSGSNPSGASYIVTEFIDGQTLKQFISSHPILFPEIGAMILVQVGRALAHAHAGGILHRDVKPENVMIRRDGVVKLTDFGISHMVDLERLTITGQLLGSPAYMAPEHVEGRPIDFRTDVFAAGIVLYQLTVGKLPFEGKNPHEVLKRIAECTFVPARKANPHIGNQLGRILEKAMAREPSDRYPAMSEMVLALEGYLADCGLDQPAAELARYFQAPGTYEVALRARLIDHLTRRGKAQLGKSHLAALDAFDRVLTLDPHNTEVLAALDRVALRRQVLRAAVALTALAALGGAWLLWGRPSRLDPVMPISPTQRLELLASSEVAFEDPPPAASAEVREPTSAPAVDAGPADAATASGPGGPHRVEPRRNLEAPAIAPLAPVTLVVSPTGSEVRLGDGPWQHVAQRLTIPLTAEDVRVTVRNDSCCEAQSRVLRAADAGTQVAISLDFLAAQIVPRCAVADVEVRVDGKMARLDGAASIPFGATTRTQRTVVVEFLGERIDRQQVIVHPAEQREVSCAL
ncbi:MAG: serine/threonine protein kinase [Myxococcales bacterium]|nr:serine/threonine protein kinase [Myxococcales bacterium]